MSKRVEEADAEEAGAGAQRLMSGIAPITLRDRLACLAASPIAPRAAQKNCNHGLFDLEARRQTDLIDELRRLKRKPQPSAQEKS